VGRVDNRVYYNRLNGNIIFQTGEAEGDVVPHDTEVELAFIDIPFGSINYFKSYISRIDNEGNPVVMHHNIHETEEQRKIRELEDALLFHAENEIGGIL